MKSSLRSNVELTSSASASEMAQQLIHVMPELERARSILETDVQFAKLIDDRTSSFPLRFNYKPVEGVEHWHVKYHPTRRWESIAHHRSNIGQDQKKINNFKAREQRGKLGMLCLTLPSSVWLSLALSSAVELPRNSTLCPSRFSFLLVADWWAFKCRSSLTYNKSSRLTTLATHGGTGPWLIRQSDKIRP